MKPALRKEAEYRHVDALFARIERGVRNEDALAKGIADCLAVCLGLVPAVIDVSKKSVASKARAKKKDQETRVARAERIRRLLGRADGSEVASREDVGSSAA